MFSKTLNSNIPDFFLVGAPKCGTTALYEYLKQHPRIFIPEQKEPAFLAKDLHFYEQVKDINAYLALFAKAKKNQLIGDASTAYSYSTSAPDEIKKLNKDAKIIFILRNPLTSLPSLHNHYLTYSPEKIRDFKKWFKKRIINKDSKDLNNIPFWKTYNYFDNIKNYQNKFKSSQILILLHDDFKKNPEREFKKVLAFLNLNTNFKPSSFDIHNEARTPRFLIIKKLWFFARALPEPIKSLLRAILPGRLRRFVWNYNLIPTKKQELSEEEKNLIRNFYKTQVTQLSKLIKRDLSNWL